MPKHYSLDGAMPANKPDEKDTGYGRPFNGIKVNPIQKTKIKIIPLSKAQKV